MISSGKILLFTALLAIFSSTPEGLCQESHKPEPINDRPHVPVLEKGSEASVGAKLVTTFWKPISAVDGDRCPSLPSCSTYSIRAFKKHGFVMGWLMTVDRLIHEGDEGSVSPTVYHNGRAKVLDPIANNNFWWARRDGSNQK